MDVIRYTSISPSAWRNGGGQTRELARFPRHGDASRRGDAFKWRVSIADIKLSGPFSTFQNYRRKMVLLRGAGLDLTFGDGSVSASVRKVGDCVEFDGGLETQCSLIDGPCLDLNLITSEEVGTVAVSVEPLREARIVKPALRHTVLILAVTGVVSLSRDSVDGAKLGCWDLAVVASQEAIVLRGVTSESVTPPLVFFAALSD